IQNHLNVKLDAEDFILSVMDYIKSNYPNAVPYSISEIDCVQINELINAKYATWDWNIGHSPNYVFNNAFKFHDSKFNVEMNVEQGIIKHCSILLDDLSHRDIAILENAITDCKHDAVELTEKLASNSFNSIFPSLPLDVFISALF
ncbi:lipoate protein ligase C-terminal domain-containing protein, partial [Bacteroidota bacterium]